MNYPIMETPEYKPFERMRDVEFREDSFLNFNNIRFSELTCSILPPVDDADWIQVKAYFPQNDIFPLYYGLNSAELKQLNNPNISTGLKQIITTSLLTTLEGTISENGFRYLKQAGNISILALEGSLLADNIWLGGVGGVTTPYTPIGSIPSIIKDFIFLESSLKDEEDWTNTLILMSCNSGGRLVRNNNVNILFNRGRIGILPQAAGELKPVMWHQEKQQFIDIHTGEIVPYTKDDLTK